jgi:hypothetical protein
LRQVSRALEQVRAQLDRQVRTLDELAFIVESVRDEVRPAQTRRRSALDQRRACLREEAAARAPSSMQAKASARGTEFRFDGGPWFALKMPEARLLLALARAPRGGSDGFGVFVPYDELAGSLSKKLTRRALVQRIYRLRTAMLESKGANPFWVETLAKVGVRLKLREGPALDCDRDQR